MLERFERECLKRVIPKLAGAIRPGTEASVASDLTAWFAANRRHITLEEFQEIIEPYEIKECD